MPIAKKDLRDGLVLVARKGTYISQDAVDEKGWADDVAPDGTVIEDNEAEYPTQMNLPPQNAQTSTNRPRRSER